VARADKLRRFTPWLLFLGAVLLMGWDLSRAAFIESHWDEESVIATGWLLSKGWKLYSGVFSHHSPADYVPAWALACLFGPRLAVFRGAMIGVWGLACLGLYVLLGRRKEEGARLIPFLFVLLSSQWLTYWMGQLMLIESFWGLSIIRLLALIATPLGFPERPVGRERALAFGFLLGFLLSASLTCALPFACLAAWLARSSHWRKVWDRVLTGAAAYAVLLLAWSCLHADLSLIWTDYVVFNLKVYSRFYPFAALGPIRGFAVEALKENASYFGHALAWRNLEQYFEGLLKLTVFGWIGWRLVRRRPFEALWWAAFVLCLRTRPERFAEAVPFHGGPFYLTATLLVAVVLARSWEAARRRWGPLGSLVAAALAAAALAPTVVATSAATLSLRPYAREDPRYEMILAAIKGCTREDDRIAVFPYYPRLYLESGRLPGVPNVFYLPWQEAWEPQRRATLESLERVRPKVVVIKDTAVWGVPWRDYGGAVEAFVAERYLSVARSADPEAELGLRLYVPSREDAPAFVKCAQKTAAP
jgi:hypothetical protein